MSPSLTYSPSVHQLLYSFLPPSSSSSPTPTGGNITPLLLEPTSMTTYPPLFQPRPSSSPLPPGSSNNSYESATDYASDLVDSTLIKNALVATVLACIILATVVGNALVITAIAAERYLQNVANYLIASLAVTDLLVAILVMPLAAKKQITGTWLLGRIACDVWTSFDVLCCTASILHLVAISIDRYWAVTRFDYVHHRPLSTIVIMIVLSWGISAVICIPPLLGWRQTGDDYSPTDESVESSLESYSSVFEQLGCFTDSRKNSVFNSTNSVFENFFSKVDCNAELNKMMDELGALFSAGAETSDIRPAGCDRFYSLASIGNETTPLNSIARDFKTFILTATDPEANHSGYRESRTDYSGTEFLIRLTNWTRSCSRKSVHRTMDCIISQDKIYTIYSTVGAFYLPLGIIIVIYLSVYRAAKMRIRKNTLKCQPSIMATTAVASNMIDAMKGSSMLNGRQPFPAPDGLRKQSICQTAMMGNRKFSTKEMMCTDVDQNKIAADSIAVNNLNVERLRQSFSEHRFKTKNNVTNSNNNNTNNNNNNNNNNSRNNKIAARRGRWSNVQPISSDFGSTQCRSLSLIMFTSQRDSSSIEANDSSDDSDALENVKSSMVELASISILNQVAQLALSTSLTFFQGSVDPSATGSDVREVALAEDQSSKVSGKPDAVRKSSCQTEQGCSSKTSGTSQAAKEENSRKDSNVSLHIFATFNSSFQSDRFSELVDKGCSSKRSSSDNQSNGFQLRLMKQLVIPTQNTDLLTDLIYNSRHNSTPAAFSVCDLRNRNSFKSPLLNYSDNTNLYSRRVNQSIGKLSVDLRSNFTKSSLPGKHISLSPKSFLNRLSNRSDISFRSQSRKTSNQTDERSCGEPGRLILPTLIISEANPDSEDFQGRSAPDDEGPPTQEKTNPHKPPERSKEDPQLRKLQRRSILQQQVSLNRLERIRALSERKHRREQTRERKAARTLAVITGSFVICWLPFFLLALVIPFCGKFCHVPHALASFINWLGYCNSLLNPIIYTVFSTDFRRAFRKILCRSWIKSPNISSALLRISPFPSHRQRSQRDRLRRRRSQLYAKLVVPPIVC